jgi:hypothetical protein
MATKGQIKFYAELTGADEGELGAFAELSEQVASSLIGQKQAARGRKGALRVHPLRTSVRKYGKHEHQRGNR